MKNLIKLLLGLIGQYGQRIALLMLLVSTCFGLPSLYAQDAAVGRGLMWLQAGSDGSLPGQGGAIATLLQSRSEAATTLKRLATVPAALSAAIDGNQEDNTEYLARKALSRLQSGQAALQLDVLAARQNADGGWGGAPFYASNALDTAWALLAMSAAPVPDSDRSARAVAYLVSVQQASGAFGISADTPSIEVTALVMQAMQAAGSSPTVAVSLDAAAGWLRSKQGADGGWGSVAATASAHLALLGSVNDFSLQAAARTYLLAQQGADGSWSGDPYVTALALRALAAQPRPVPTKGNVTLQVVDAESGQPLAGALATLQGSVVAPALTDATGRAAFKDIDANTYTVVVSAPGYASLSTSFTLVAGTTVNAGLFKMSVVPSTGMVKGVVRDAASGAPLGDAQVVVAGGANASTATAADGSYVLAGLAPGAVSITVSKSGYKPVAATGNVAAGGVLAFSPLLSVSTTPAGEPDQPADPALPGALTGKVVDAASGAAISGVTVSLGGALVATSAADGRFLLSGIPAGSYTLQVQKSGYASRSGTVLIAASVRTDIQNVPLSKDQSSVAVQGTVTDLRSGKPIAGAHVSVAGSGQEASTDAAGNYRLEGMAVGAATLRFAATGYAGETMMASFPAVGNYRVDAAMSLDDGANPSFSQLATERDVYGAYESVTFSMAVDNKADQLVSDAEIDLTVFDERNNVVSLQQVAQVGADGMTRFLIPVPAKSQVNVDSKWNTVAYAPGRYLVKARLFRSDAATGGKAVISERTAAFTIEPSRKLVRLAVTPMPAFTVIDANVQMSMQVDAVNQSNVPLTTSFKVAFKGPDGALLKEQEGSLTLQPAEMVGALQLEGFPYHFGASGVYPVELTISSGETPQALVNGQVQAAPGVRVEATQQVTPTSVTPDGDKRIRIQLQLKGVETK